ncbi:MAG TPA: hypothetical protein VF514_16560 [Bacteroidota bacterium]
MTPKVNSSQIRGSVVETFEMGGRVVIRLSITGGSLDFLSEPADTFHLGDTLLLAGEFRLCSVKPALDTENHHQVPDADFLS